MTFGVDYAWGRPGIPALNAAGVKFAARYLSYDTTGKNLTRSEAQALSDDAVWVVVVWESSANRTLDGYGAGRSDAQEAARQAAACGMPSDRPIYFAVDFDAGPSDEAAINAYLDGAAGVLGKDRVGIYGGYYPVKSALSGGHAKWGWQTYAWSGGQWWPGAQLHQYSNDHIIGGVDLDYDEAPVGDYGQWQVGRSPHQQPPQQEDDMRGNLDKGQGSVTSLSWPQGDAKAIGFFADTGLLKSGPLKLRVAFNMAPDAKGDVGYNVQEISLDSGKKKKVVVFGAHAADVDSVSVERLNGTGNESIGWDAS